MPVFTRNDVSILFIHIPKTGGTTIETAFERAGYAMSWRRGGAYGPLTAEDKAARCSPQHMHARLLDERLGDRRFDRIFCVVRHPVARFVSEYRFQVKAGHAYARKSIDDFARNLIWRHGRNPRVLDNHIRPQVDFLWRGCEVFRFEDGLDAILAALSRDLPGPMSVAGEQAMRSDPAIPADPAPETVARLRAFYRADFETFGYE